MISSRKIEDLHPKVRDKCISFIAACGKADIDVILTSTYRDHAAQAELYAKGRTAPGKRVTNAKPGYSFHQYRVAFDFAPIINGKIPWNDIRIWTICGEIGEGLGFEWAGRWNGFKEYAHLQYTNGKTIEHFLAGGTI